MEGCVPVVPLTALKATLGILERTVRLSTSPP
jgi:hypothetical protein